MKDVSRRALLGTVPAGALGLAGCTDIPGMDGGPSGNAFDAVQVEGVELVVVLTDDADLSQVNVIAPDGSVFDDQPVSAGQTRLTFDLADGYQPGSHRVVGVRDGDRVAETSLDISPAVEIVEVGVGANHLDRMPEGLPFREEQALISFQNTGTGPQILKRVVFDGEIPNPTEEDQLGEESTGLFDSEEGFGDLERPTVPVDGTVTFYSNTRPFLFTGDGIQCEPEPQEGTGECRAEVRIATGPINSRFGVAYTGSNDPNDCQVTISEVLE